MNEYKDELPVQSRRSVHVLATEPSTIWGEVFDKDINDINEFYAKMKELVCEKSTVIGFKVLSFLLYWSYYRSSGKFIDESIYMSKKIANSTAAEIALLQRLYTLAHVAFCSTITYWDKELQRMVCFRSMDWDGADQIAGATRIFDYKNRTGETIAIVAGIAGMHGALTGVKQGFSIVMNYAPGSFSARFKPDPTFLVREILQDETIDTYDKAKRAISSWKAGAPCFITLCGVNKGEASVCEIGAGDQKFWRESDPEGFLVQTNHFSCEHFLRHNKKFYDQEPSTGWYSSELLENSLHRQQLITEKFQALHSTGENLIHELKEIYREPPVMNKKTAQWVLMTPGNGPLEESALEATALIMK